MNKNPLQTIRPLFLVFIFTNVFFIAGKTWLRKKGIDTDLLLLGNLILFAVSLAAFFISRRALRSANPQSFVRAMYGSFLVKFFVLVIAAFAYIISAKKNVNKPALGVCAALYIIYTIIETRALTRLLKMQKNAQERSTY